jgi:hypothetical protein
VDAAPRSARDVLEPSTDLVALRVLIPRNWRDALAEAAGTQGISMADLMRIVIRGFLRDRYNGDERAALGAS